jgi:hypothetical protein
MAIVRTAGTEIIRTAMFEDIDSTTQKLIIGEKHHIYTVLSIVICAVSVQAVGNQININFQGYDSKGGTTDETMRIFRWRGVDNETFVWNDKFSFNGYEPANFSGPLDDATKQNAIVDQDSSVAQYLWANTTHADDNFEVLVTYIDQNNA